ncbi:MAG TPA: CapA family protein [Pseudonocardiaceae bacterium]
MIRRGLGAGALLAASVLVSGCVVAGAPSAAPAAGAPQVTTAAPRSTAAPATVTIAAVGDVIMGSAPDKLPPDEGRGFFDRVAEALAADLTTGNLETPLSDPTGHGKCPPPPAPDPAATAPPQPSRCFAFRVPPSYAGVLDSAGFDVLALANNHTNDAGPAGLRNTRDALRGAGILPTGGEAEIARVEVNGISIAVLGFGPYSWMQNVTDLDAAAELVRTADRDADLVVVNMHVGAEGADQQHVRPGTERFLGENRGDPMAFARGAIEAGADLVVGHGPHVLRGMEFHQGRLIAYSMGNFAGYRVLNSAGPLGIGGVLRVTLAADGSWAGGSLVPTAMVDGGFPAVDGKGRAVPMVRDLSTADFPGTAATLAPDGTITP